MEASKPKDREESTGRLKNQGRQKNKWSVSRNITQTGQTQNPAW